MATLKDEKFWREFLELYKNLPELWKFGDKIYKNKIKRAIAYEKLLCKLQEMDPNATIDTLKAKINTFRGSYRRELHKIRTNQNSTENYEYVPTLWYFKDLSFLYEHIDCTTTGELDESNIKNKSTSTSSYTAPKKIRHESNEKSTKEPEISSRKSKQTEEEASSHTAPKKIRQERKENEKCTLPETLSRKPKQTEDEATIFSTAWEVLFRKLSPSQQLFANKTIMEVLYQGALGRLDENAHRLIDKPQSSINTPIQNSGANDSNSDPDAHQYIDERNQHLSPVKLESS